MWEGEVSGERRALGPARASNGDGKGTDPRRGQLEVKTPNKKGAEKEKQVGEQDSSHLHLHPHPHPPITAPWLRTGPFTRRCVLNLAGILASISFTTPKFAPPFRLLPLPCLLLSSIP